MFDLWSIASVINFEHNRQESRALLQSIIGNFKTIQVQAYTFQLQARYIASIRRCPVI